MPIASVLDGHNDLPYALRENYAYNLDAARLGEGNPDLHTDIPSLRAGTWAPSSGPSMCPPR